MTDINAPISTLDPTAPGKVAGPAKHHLRVEDVPDEREAYAAAKARSTVHRHDDEDDDHEHPAIDLLTGLRIAYAALCVVAIWFVEAFFFDQGSFLEGVHEFFQWFDPWPVLAVSAFIPQFIRDLIPPPIFNWIDINLAMPFSTYAYTCLLFSGWPILKESVKDLFKLRMSMELSMTIAMIAGCYTGYFFVAAIVVLFVLVAEVLEGLTVGRGRRAIRELLEFLPRQVTVRRGGTPVEIDVDTLRAGETVLVAPGERIPVDGTVIGGYSFVDESRITGESMPVEKVADGPVYAGSINQSGALEIRTQRIGADTSYGKIIEAVERAERSRAPIARTSDRLAGWIVMFAIAFAIATQIAWHDVNTSISVLVVAGACGVAAGTPLAILGAIGRSARLGGIVKGGAHLQMLYRVNTVVLDKTGTLTFGEPRVTAVAPAPGVMVDEVLAAAAAAEVRSEHPLGKAIVDKARGDNIAFTEPADFRYTPGRGIQANVKDATILVGNEAWLSENRIALAGLVQAADDSATSVYVARDGKLLGAIAIADTLRPEARFAIAGLHQRNIRTILLTGDNKPVADAIAREVGISDVEANLLPEQKVARVRQLVADGRIVAMVGDGVNDAPALAEANVGVAMGSGTDVARESADVVLLGNDLARFVEMIDVARWTRRIIYQNFIGTCLVDILGVMAALAGIIGPVIAINIHTISELVFISNSSRLLPRKWDPFVGWRRLYNSWNMVGQWGAGIAIGGIVISFAAWIYTIYDPHIVIVGPLGDVPDKAHAFAVMMISGGGLVFLAGLLVLAVGLVVQRSSRMAVPAE